MNVQAISDLIKYREFKNKIVNHRNEQKGKKNRVIKVIQWAGTGPPTVVTAKAKLQCVMPSALVFFLSLPRAFYSTLFSAIIWVVITDFLAAEKLKGLGCLRTAARLCPG